MLAPMTSAVTPFVLEPLAVARPWGGTRARAFVEGASAEPADSPIGEWWLVSSREPASRILTGPNAGRSLPDLLAEHGEEVLGRALAGKDEPFPLLVKVLDAVVPLSVQVHPSDALSPGDGKTESWYVLNAEEDAVLYLGLRDGASAEDLFRAV